MNVEKKHSCQEFLTFKKNEKSVSTLHNFTIDESSCSWRYVHQRVLPPACLPQEVALFGFGSAFEVTKLDSLLRGSIQAGISLTIPRLLQVCKAVKCPMPAEGRGKGGRKKKVDYVKPRSFARV